MTAEIIKDEALWDMFIDDSTYGMLFHKSRFLDCMNDVFKGKLLKFGIYDGEKLIAVFPLFYKSLYGIKTVFSPPPMTGVPYLGFVVHPEYDSLKQDKKESWLNLIAEDISKEVEKCSANYIFFSGVPDFLDIRPFKWYGYSIDMRYSYKIDLTRPVDVIWGSFKKILRKQIKQAEKANLQLYESADPALFCELHDNRYVEQGLSSPLNKMYIEKLLKSFPENIKLYYLFQDQRVVTSVITSEYNGRVDVLWGNPKVDGDLFANEYLIWKLIQNSIDKNFISFVIIGANIKRLCQFKSKFNPNLEFSFSVSKKDILGKTVESVYNNILKKNLFWRGYNIFK